jgi:hypothetical protein
VNAYVTQAAIWLTKGTFTKEAEALNPKQADRLS